MTVDIRPLRRVPEEGGPSIVDACRLGELVRGGPLARADRSAAGLLGGVYRRGHEALLAAWLQAADWRNMYLQEMQSRVRQTEEATATATARARARAEAAAGARAEAAAGARAEAEAARRREALNAAA